MRPPKVTAPKENTATKITTKQLAVLAAIERLTTAKGFPPSLRELAAAVGIGSPAGVACHLTPLQQKGYVTWEQGKERTLRLTCAAQKAA